MRAACLLAVVLGVVLRLLAAVSYEHPRGDVALDVGVARSLAAGHGFRSGFERGTALIRGTGPLPPQGWADQHAPLWPLLAAPLALASGDAFGALRLLSLLFGVLLLLQVWRLTDRLVEGQCGAPDGLPALATALTALSFLMVESSANGSLYGAQAVGALLLIECLAAPRPSALKLGGVLGLLLLLNHQCLVLLPLVPLVWVLGVPACQRKAGLLRALAALAVVALMQVPWWWRNAALFGDPTYSVNGLYLLARLGVEPQLGLENGLPVARLIGNLDAARLLGALKSSLAPNLLYMFVAGMLVLPMLLGVLATRAWAGLSGAYRSCDRRRLGAWGVLGIMAAIAVIWPATKLRYLVILMPLATCLGVAELGAAMRSGKTGKADVSGGPAGLGLVALLLAWLGLVLITRDDLTGDAELPRPERWWWLAAGGLCSVIMPAGLEWRRRVRRVNPSAAPVLLAGLPLAAVLLALTVARVPPTAYHNTGFLPDFFGQDAEGREAELGQALARLREPAATGVPGPLSAAGLAAEGMDGGKALVVGPVALLAWERPGLVSLPLGAGSDAGAAALAAILAEVYGPLGADPLGHQAGHPVGYVITRVGDGWLPEHAATGHVWLDGKLALMVVVDPRPDVPGALQLSRVLR